MKRSKVVFLSPDAFGKVELQGCLPQGVEVEKYEAKQLKPERGIEDEYDFDALWDAMLETANGVWLTVKGLFRLSAWTVFVIVGGIKLLWKQGVGKEKEKGKVNNGKAKEAK